MTLNIFRKLLRRAVAARGLLAHRGQDDVVEISVQPLAPRRAGSFRILFADRLRNFVRHTALEAVRKSPAQQFVQHDTQ